MQNEEVLGAKYHDGLGVLRTVETSCKMHKTDVKLSGIRARVTLELKDENNKTVRQRTEPSHSFVLNFMRLLYAVFTASTITAKDTDGNSTTVKLARVRTTVSYRVEDRTITYTREYAGFHAWALKEDDSHGVLIGTGTTSLSEDDHKLAEKINNGFSIGNMLYLTGEVGRTTVIGNDAYLQIKRSFINHSGYQIIVREIGCAIRQFSPSANILFIRDLIIPETVPNDYTLDVTYTIVVTAG